MEWNLLEEGYEGIPHQPTWGTQKRYIIWKNSNEQDVHEPIIVSGMANMQRKKNWGMVDSR